MQCKRKYQWVKLPRCCLPQGKGVLGQWARLAARAAYRKGTGRYCGFENPVEPGMWAGGVVGLKSILGVKSRQAALGTLKRLQEMGYLRYTLDPGTKKLEYRLTDWVAACTGEACRSQGVYAYEGQGFLCLPRALPDRLVKQHAVFEEADALLDLWCHTVWQDPKNIFSHMAPVVQFGSLGAVLTLETLGSRWGWEKTKVWRFFQKHGDVFPLYRLPGAYGCLVFNARYPTEQSLEGMGRPLPSQEDLLRILREIRMCAGNAHITGTDNQRLTLELYAPDGTLLESWETSDIPHVITGLPVGEGYVLKETAAPEGYELAEDIVFAVENTAEIQFVGMVDEPSPEEPETPEEPTEPEEPTPTVPQTGGSRMALWVGALLILALGSLGIVLILLKKQNKL